MTIFRFNNELSSKIKRKTRKHDEVDLIKAEQEQKQLSKSDVINKGKRGLEGGTINHDF